LTPEEVAARFGPTAADYEAVKTFARSNGLAIAATHGNRLVLDVTGSAAAVEKAFHVRLQTFQHPTEARTFFSPDAEPTVDVKLPLLDIEGLSDYSRAHPKSLPDAGVNDIIKSGSSPDGGGYYFGDDFRNAYVPGTTLTGAGQAVGIYAGDGYYAYDINLYASYAGRGRTNIIIQPVLIDGFNGVPHSQSFNSEVSLDIEMAMAMAPGLSRIVVFEGNPTNIIHNDILNTMAASNTIKSLSCSWGWNGGPTNTTDNIFKTMDAQGQTFFDASGDTDAFTVGANSVAGVDNPALGNMPSSNPYIVQVGATELTMNGAGTSYASEAVWNLTVSNYNGVGSSGGVSSYYTIPSWQTNISMSVNLGSITMRNLPDVAAAGSSIFVIYNDGYGFVESGTSCAAPLWAGFTALVNQQLAINTGSTTNSVGFINPAIYAIGRGQNPLYNYAACFHDITSGNNYWSNSPALYPAVAGYDLCTGWGTPKGTNLINALVTWPGTLGIKLATHLTNGIFSINYPAVTNYTYVLERSTNLSPSAQWLPVATNISLITGTTNFGGIRATNRGGNFYRVRTSP
jgi:subtilase family serine protease